MTCRSNHGNRGDFGVSWAGMMHAGRFGMLVFAVSGLLIAIAGANAEDTPPEEMASPQARPAAPAQGVSPEAGANVPVPESRPPPPSEPEEAMPTVVVEGLSRPPLVPLDERFCRKRLTELKARFLAGRRITDPLGCSIDHPLTLMSLSAEIDLEPDAVLNCATALAAAEFITRVASPAAEEILGQPIIGISQVSAYVCRPRNGSDKLSEHAFGNALDIGAFTLADGTVIEVREHGEDAPESDRFLDTVREHACGPFKTVLGPGADADHAAHLHFDQAARRNGSTFCQ